MNTPDKQERQFRVAFIIWIVGWGLLCLVGGAFLLLGYYVVPQAALPIWKYGRFVLIFSAVNLFSTAYMLLQFNKLVARLKSTAK